MIIQVYAADRSGQSWDVRQTSDASETLTLLERLRAEYPGRVYGVYDYDDPERGDIEMELEEAVYEQQSLGLGVPL
jgi:hypothetical protein